MSYRPEAPPACQVEEPFLNLKNFVNPQHQLLYFYAPLIGKEHND